MSEETSNQGEVHNRHFTEEVGLSEASFTSDTRYSFTAQYLCSAALFARRSAAIEQENVGVVDDEKRMEHRAYVTAAIMQSVAAVEAESAEITIHGSGRLLAFEKPDSEGVRGANKLDPQAVALVTKLADEIDEQGTSRRFEMILLLLRKEPLEKGHQPTQDMDLLIRLRNELIHYKSKWGREMSEEKLFKSLGHLRHPKPSWVPEFANFFPERCLSAACARWAVRTAVAYIDAVYDRIGATSPLAAYMSHFAGL